MNFARWESRENMQKNLSLTKLNYDSEVKTSGFPMMYDDSNLYIDTRLNHSLVIGTIGSGKTQAITLPILKLACKAGESVVVHDSKSELYDNTSELFKTAGYNVIKLNFDVARDCNCWDPFELPYELYKSGNKDKAQELIENLGFYLLDDMEEKSIDPFWINSSIDYFTGLTLYMIENEKEVNLDKLYELDSKVRENPSNFIENIDKKSSIYINLSGVLKAPEDTGGSIFSVFSQKLKKYISKENLKNMLSKSDFDIAKLGSEKTIIYIISGDSNSSQNLIPLLTSQIYFAKNEYSPNVGRINVIIDDFYLLNEFKNFAKMLDNSRSLDIIFTIMIRGFNDLKNVYGKEGSEILKFCFANIVYLLSQDIDTLEEISKLCGNTNENGIIKPLVTIEQLKTLNVFEAIILTPRIMPFKTKLLPYYQFKK